MLKSGAFDPFYADQRAMMRERKARERDPWKAANYEEHWGEQLLKRLWDSRKDAEGAVDPAGAVDLPPPPPPPAAASAHTSGLDDEKERDRCVAPQKPHFTNIDFVSDHINAGSARTERRRRGRAPRRPPQRLHLPTPPWRSLMVRLRLVSHTLTHLRWCSCSQLRGGQGEVAGVRPVRHLDCRGHRRHH